MGVTIQSGNTSVTGSVSATVTSSLPTPSATQTVINISATGNGAVQSAYTVPASKTFYLFGAFGNAGAVNSYYYKTDGTTLVYQINQNAGTNSNSLASPVPIWSYATGEVVKVNTTNAIPYGFWGVLQ